MPIVIQPYIRELVRSVKQFNERLKAGGSFSDFLFFEHYLSESLPKIGGRRIFDEYFLALDNGIVRGAFALKHQEFFFSGQGKPVAFYHYPLSEGIVERAYVNVGVQMLRTAAQDHPLLFALGMGGFDRPLPRMLKARGWKLTQLPFYFKVVHPFRFLRGMAELRNAVMTRLAADIGAFTGLGSAVIIAAQKLREKSPRSSEPLHAVQVQDFGDWADRVWQVSYPRYAMIGDRSRDALRILYPPESRRFIKVKVENPGDVVGWAVLLDTQMRSDRHFGDLRVGSIVDCLARPENARGVIVQAARFLMERGVDLVVSNQSHASWTGALHESGFLQGPSNCVFAASSPMAELLQPFESKVRESHINRGDGDGPIHL